MKNHTKKSPEIHPKFTWVFTRVFTQVFTQVFTPEFMTLLSETAAARGDLETALGSPLGDPQDDCIWVGRLLTSYYLTYNLFKTLPKILVFIFCFSESYKNENSKFTSNSLSAKVCPKSTPKIRCLYFSGPYRKYLKKYPKNTPGDTLPNLR